MASISTCLTITPNNNANKPYLKHSLIFSVKPSRQFYNSLCLATHNRHSNAIFHKQILKLAKQNNDDNRSYETKIRAGFDHQSEETPTPGRIIESDKLAADVRKLVMDAVDECGRRVTDGDVASMAGIKLHDAQKALQALTADANGVLEVSDEGDVLYVFPENYRSKLASKSLRIKGEQYLNKAMSAAEFLVKVTFGATLIASVVIVGITIVVIVLSLSAAGDSDSTYYSDSDSDEDNRGTSFNSEVSCDSNEDNRGTSSSSQVSWQEVQKQDKGMNFIESVFSFVFGDGDPSAGVEEERWKSIGQYIGSHGGVVIAQELTPYLDVENSKTMDDDSCILPILLRFNGQPQVDEEGNIYYWFPSLQRTAASEISSRKEYLEGKFSEHVGGADMFFKERKRDFSKTSMKERVLVGGLAGFNLFGVLLLGSILNDVTMEPNGFISFVSKIFPFLQIYAASFFAIPLFRWFIILYTNSKIDKRNQVREMHARALELPDVSLIRKIRSARRMSQRIVIGQDQIVYTTEIS